MIVNDLLADKAVFEHIRSTVLYLLCVHLMQYFSNSGVGGARGAGGEPLT